jgi:3-oxoacyl-[acyl-carrier-protein] synthase II
MRDDVRDDVLVTGMGAVAPIGADVPSLWRGMLVGRSGLTRERRMDLSDLPGGWVAGLIDEQTRAAVIARSGAVDHSGRPRRSWGDTLLHHVVDQALRDARWPDAASPADADRPVGLVWSRLWPGPLGPWPDDHEEYFARLASGERRPRPDSQPQLPPELTDCTDFPQRVAARLGVPLLSTRLEATCAGGLRALVEGARLLRSGRTGLVVVAASVSRHTPSMLSQFAQLGALSRWRGDPRQASMPFDRRRCGMVIGESAAAMVLESTSHAAARGVSADRVPAVIRGWGLHVGTGHVTAPDGQAMEHVMRTALEHSGLDPDDVDTVNAHGTSTVLNDREEAQALHRLLGARARQVPVCAVKSLTGHASAASGVVESVAAVLSIAEGVVPPVATCEEPDPACDLAVSREPTHLPVSVVLKNSFGFGGQYASIVFQTPQ